MATTYSANITQIGAAVVNGNLYIFVQTSVDKKQIGLCIQTDILISD